MFISKTFTLFLVVAVPSVVSAANLEQRQLEATCDDASFEIVDHGYNDEYRGWYDPSGCGVCNQYCRWVGNSGSGGNPAERLTHGASWWSCQIGSDIQNSNAEIWSRYEELGSSFSFSKCSGKNSDTPMSAVSPNPPQWFAKENTDGLVMHTSALFNNQIMNIGASDGINPGQWTIADVQFTNTNQFNLNDYPLLILEKSGGGPIVIICQNQGPKCRVGTTTYSDDANNNGMSAMPAQNLSMFDGLDPTGDWKLHLGGGGPNGLSSWSLTFQIVDSNGNRRMLRGVQTGDQN